MPCSSSPSQHPPTLPLSSSPNSPHKLSRSFFKSWWDLFTSLSSILLRKVWIKIKSLQVSGLHIATPAGAAGITLKLIPESASKSIGSHQTPKSIKVQHSWRIPLTVIVESFGRQNPSFLATANIPLLRRLRVTAQGCQVKSSHNPKCIRSLPWKRSLIQEFSPLETPISENKWGGSTSSLAPWQEPLPTIFYSILINLSMGQQK